jgi:5-methylcytosine-specific restriction endonuclease McrA
MSVGLKTLVLNSDGTALGTCGINTIPTEDAVCRVINDTCYVVESHDRKIQTKNLDMYWPSVIATKQYISPPSMVRLRPTSLYYRDHGMCAYCGQLLTKTTKSDVSTSLTKDHVVPTSRGGSGDWDNIVAACGRCNSLKGDEMPTGIWKPRIKPYAPTPRQLMAIRRKFPLEISAENWIPYLGKWKGEIILEQTA